MNGPSDQSLAEMLHALAMVRLGPGPQQPVRMSQDAWTYMVELGIGEPAAGTEPLTSGVVGHWGAVPVEVVSEPSSSGVAKADELGPACRETGVPKSVHSRLRRLARALLGPG